MQGNRKFARPLNYKITTEITPAGFRGGEDERSEVAFYAPCSFVLSFTIRGKLQRGPVSYAVFFSTSCVLKSLVLGNLPLLDKSGPLV